ncbi:MAG TPA: hypothetical protein VF497_14745 [Rudaea sp.]
MTRAPDARGKVKGRGSSGIKNKDAGFRLRRNDDKSRTHKITAHSLRAQRFDLRQPYFAINLPV